MATKICAIVPRGTVLPDGTVVCCDDGQENLCVRITINESPGYVEVGGQWQFHALLHYTNGQTEDVTDKATWAITEEFATIDTHGLAVSEAVGVASVSASYCNLTGAGQLEIVSACVDPGIDIVMVLDRSASMRYLSTDGRTRIEHAKEAAKALADNLDYSRDQLALVTFAGVYSPGPPVSGSKDATIDHSLSGSAESIKAAVDAHYNIRGPCLFPDEVLGPNTRCATGMGGGLEEGWNELESSRHRAGSERVMVLFTDGGENVNSPAPTTVATDAKNDGVIIIVVGLDVPAFYMPTLASLASDPALVFTPGTAEELAQVFAKLPHVFCYGQGGYSWGALL